MSLKVDDFKNCLNVHVLSNLHEIWHTVAPICPLSIKIFEKINSIILSEFLLSVLGVF